MKASDWIIDFLARQGIDTLYGYIGGMVTHLIDSASKNPSVRFIQTYHEQSAAFAAEGYARIKGVPGVAIATSGPGATNMLTGIADAYFDSIPMIYITGQVNTNEYKYGKPIRQQGFQEVDIVAMARPVTKYVVMIDNPEKICYEFEKALSIVVTGRPGPVLIDLPMNIQCVEIDPGKMEHFVRKPAKDSSSDLIQERLLAVIQQSERPLLLLGGGCVSSGISDALNELLKAGLPAVTSLMGKGAVDETFPLFGGMLGTYGNRCANLIVARADRIIVMGSRLDTRQTGARLEEFTLGKRIFQVDIDSAEMENHRLKNREVLIGNLVNIAPGLKQIAKKISVSEDWRREVAVLKERYSQRNEVERFVANKLPYHVMEIFSGIVAPDAIFSVDIGQNQMWAAQTIQLTRDQRFLTSGGMAAMGYSIPVAVGAAMAAHRPVIAITGDGGLQIALQSLPLIAQYHLPVVVVVLNNASLGMITQFQSLYFNSNFVATTSSGGYLVPNLEKLAEAFNLPYFSAKTQPEFENSLKAALQGRNALVDVRIEPPTTVSPKREFTQPFYNMSPALPDEELQCILSGKMN